MKVLQHLFGGAMLIIGLAQTLPATPITYSTLVVGIPGSPSVVFTDGITSVLYSQLTSASADPTSGPTFSSLGTFTVVTTSSSLDIIPPTLFTIRVNEVAPVAGSSGDFTVTLAGAVSKTSSSATAAFTTSPASSPATVAVGAYSFQLNNTNPVALVPPSTNGGATTLQAQITQSASTAPAAVNPEPGTLFLLGMGLLLAVVLVRRKTSA